MHGLETIKAMNNRTAPRTPERGELWRTRDGSTVVFIRKTGRALAGVILQHPDEAMIGSATARELDGRYDNAKLHEADLVDCLGRLPAPGEKLGR